MTKVAVYGNAIIDEFIRLPFLPGRGGDVLAEGSESHVGGCGANVAVTLARLGLPTTLVGRLGDDSRGRRIKAYLEGEGVETGQLTLAEGETTTYCLTLVEPDGERTFITILGSAGDSPPSLDLGATGAWSALYVSGYSLVGPGRGAATLGLMQETRGRGVPVVFDPGPLAKRDAAEYLGEAVKLSTAVLASRGELAELSELGEAGPEVVVIKHGRAGAELHLPGQAPLLIPALEVEAVDTTGAGDAFAAGFIYGLVNAWPAERAVRFAAACGAAATRVAGPVGVRDLEQVEQMLSCGVEPRQATIEETK